MGKRSEGPERNFSDKQRIKKQKDGKGGRDKIESMSVRKTSDL